MVRWVGMVQDSETVWPLLLLLLVLVVLVGEVGLLVLVLVDVVLEEVVEVDVWPDCVEVLPLGAPPALPPPQADSVIAAASTTAEARKEGRATDLENIMTTCTW